MQLNKTHDDDDKNEEDGREKCSCMCDRRKVVVGGGLAIDIGSVGLS